ncbi:hypothetical protein GGI21_000410 [Coemansia aciculifera]|nr:hypothetical protein GGI21_000410 [Coemansia aciculifera]
MSMVNVLTVACYGLMVAYTTVYLTGIKTVVLGFVQFTMGFIALVLAVLAAPICEDYYEHFPVFKDAPDRVFTIGLWQCALGAFIIGDPLFMEFRDASLMQSRSSWAQSMGMLTLATSIGLGSGFVFGIIGFMRFDTISGLKKTEEKDRDDDEAMN